MTAVDLKPEWSLRLSSEELTLIRKALGDRLTEEDDAKAKLLEREIADQQVKQVAALAQSYGKLAANIDKDRKL